MVRRESPPRLRRWRGPWAMAAWIGGCGVGPEPAEAAGPRPSTEPRPDDHGHAVTLLARARASLRDGSIDPPLREAILGARAPELARARRLLEAFDAPDAPTVPPSGAAPVPPVPVAPPQPGPGPTAEPEAPIQGATDPGDGPTPALARPVPPQPQVSSLGLRATQTGASLVIRGSGKLVVGTASQKASRIVRLVIDNAKIGASALAARPHVEGVAVTTVRQGRSTVQITVQLSPGLALGTVRRVRGGTAVEFVRAP